MPFGLNNRIREVAARYDAIVIEIFKEFALDHNPDDLILDDCVHTNDAGHEIIFRKAREAYEAFLMQ